MKKLTSLMLALALVLSLASVACAEETGSIYYLNFKPEVAEAWESLAAAYTAETGVPMTVITAASGTYEDTLKSEIAKTEAPTLFQVNGPVGLNTWKDYCYDMSGSAFYGELTSDAFALKDGDAVLGIAYLTETYGLITNTALLEKAGYSVADITNFETLKAVAEDITARKDELGFSAFTSAGMDGSSSWRFTGHVANLEYYYESVDNPDAWKSCPAELTGAYMQNYRNLLDLMFENSTVDRSALAAGGFDANAEFANGEAAFYVNGSWAWNDLQASMKAEDLAMIPYYRGVEGEEKAALNCGTENYWAVNCEADEADIQATLDFMYWLVTNTAASEKAVATFGVMPYKQAAASANPFFVDANNYLAAGNYNLWWATNYQPNVDAYRAALVSAINDYNANPSDATWATVETAFVQGWATQYAAAQG